VYNPIPNKTVITGGVTKSEVQQLIREHDRVMMMGHGSPGGLFSVGQFDTSNRYGYGGYIIDQTMVPALKEKDNSVFIWCNADRFVDHYNLKGFYSGMFISELGEVWCSGHKNITQSMIDESNSCFSEELGSLIALAPKQIYEAMEHGRYAKLAQTNLIAAYNFERLHYDALLNVNAI
jgi:hypothetical protein